MPSVYVNKLLTQVFRPALAAADPIDGVKPTMVTRFPANVLEVAPIIIAKGTPGSERDARFGADSVTVQIDVYALDEDTAQAWAAWCRDILRDAWLQQTVYGEGHISSFVNGVIPWRFPDSAMPDGVERYTAEYTLGVKTPVPA